MTDSFQTYLAAKRAVDDRALSRRVWATFVDELEALGASRDGPVRILEIGGGVGTMVARLADRAALPTSVRYRLIDRDGENVAFARANLPGWLEDAGYSTERTPTGLVARADAVTDDDGERVVSDEPGGECRERTDERGAGTARRTLEISLETGDALSVANGTGGAASASGGTGEASAGHGFDEAGTSADVVIAAAVVDVLDEARLVDWLRSTLGEGGLFYAPITYDGATGFAPIDPLDERIERLYHRHMDEVRDVPGASRAGRRLLATLARNGFERLDADGADWIVQPRDGRYRDADATVLRYVLATIDDALADYPEPVLDPDERRRWIETRLDQLARSELTLVAHNLDVLARR